MNLSDLYNVVPKYAELAWVCAPNATAQSVASNTITTLFMNTKVQDVDSIITSFTPGNTPTSSSTSITTNFNLGPGTYLFEGESNIQNSGDLMCLMLFNNTLSKYESRGLSGTASTYYAYYCQAFIKSQFVITQNCNFIFRAIASSAGTIKNDRNVSSWTNNTADLQQRTTLRIWKLK